MHARLEHRLFARLFDGGVDLASDLVHHFLYAGGMDASVGDEFLESETRHFAPYGIEAGQRDDVRGVVDDEIDARRGLEGADVPAHASDDPALHFVVGECHYADGVLRRVIRRATLYGGGNDILRLADGVLFRLRFDGFRLGCGALLYIFEMRVFKFRRRLFPRHARDSFQLTLHDLL